MVVNFVAKPGCRIHLKVKAAASNSGEPLKILSGSRGTSTTWTRKSGKKFAHFAGRQEGGEQELCVPVVAGEPEEEGIVRVTGGSGVHPGIRESGQP